MDDSAATRPYRYVNDLEKLFRVEVSPHCTDFVVTNDLTQGSTHDTQEVCAMLDWIRMTEIARKTGQTIYYVKHVLLDDYLRQQLKIAHFIK